MTTHSDSVATTEHEHQLEAILIRNPDRYYMASRDDIVTSWRCTTCPHVESSPGWDGTERIRRDELCECCDGPVEKMLGKQSAQDIGRFQPMRIIDYYECTECQHEQYFYEDEAS